MLKGYVGQIEFNDVTNREGYAAKVYFDALFGMEFTRSSDNTINAALNYGYSIILSAVNREVTSNGYLTQFGLFHDNNEYETLSEKIIDYMLNVRQFEGEKLFILVNYRNYVVKSEAEAFIKTIIGHKIKLLLIEGSEREKLRNENRIIIDTDLCEIY